MSMRRVEYPPPGPQAPPPMTKEVAMVQWMDGMLNLQKMQMQATFRVAQAVSRIDEDKLPFGAARQDFDTLQKMISAVDGLADKWGRAR